MPFLALLIGPLGRIGLYVVGALAVIAAAAFIVHEHDARIRAEDAAHVAAVTAAEELRQSKANAAALSVSLADAQARATATATTKTEIARAPVTNGCAASPAVAAALDGLRRAAGAGSGAPANPGGAVVVPAAAGSAKPAAR